MDNVLLLGAAGLPALLNPVEPEFYVLVATIIFLAIIWRVGAVKGVMKTLDERAAKIRAELENAAKLKAEAETLLASFADQQAQAEKSAAQIVANAKIQAEQIRKDGLAALEAEIARRTLQAERRIEQAKMAAQADVRKHAVEMASEGARRLLAEQMPAAKANNLIDDAIAGLEKNWS